MPSDFLWPLLDPTAPLPAYWPGGGVGAFLLFLIPIGGGIPLGVIMGTDAGVSPVVLALMYLVSDMFMAVTHEPFFWLLAWLAKLIPSLGKMRDFFARASATAGLKDEGAHGPLGLILFSFTIDPVSARGAAAAAGHGFLAGWTFSIIGDMLYFGVLMATTLWLRGLFGDDRATIGVTMLAVWGVSWYIRRQRGQTLVGQPAPAARSAAVAEQAASIDNEPSASGTSAQRQPPRSTPPTSAAIRKKAGRKRRSH